jgi:hypothetical protein
MSAEASEKAPYLRTSGIRFYDNLFKGLSLHHPAEEVSLPVLFFWDVLIVIVSSRPQYTQSAECSSRLRVTEEYGIANLCESRDAEMPGSRGRVPFQRTPLASP